MLKVKALLAIASIAGCFIGSDRITSQQASETADSFQTKSHQAPQDALKPNSLCAMTEHILFSCRVKRSGARAAKSSTKIVSLCASSDLDQEHGYLQYRYGLPGRVELEFPGSRSGTQQMFQYTHYMRYQVDLTEINFTVADYQYQIFDNYNGEEKPAIAEAGVYVTAPGKGKEATFVCRGKAQADFSTLQDVLLDE